MYDAKKTMWRERNFRWIGNYIKDYDHTLFDIMAHNSGNVNDPYSTANAVKSDNDVYIGKVQHLRKYIIYIKTPKGPLVLNKPFHSNIYTPMVCGVLNTDEYIEYRNMFVLNDMTENDVIGFLEELYK